MLNIECRLRYIKNLGPKGSKNKVDNSQGIRPKDDLWVLNVHSPAQHM